MLFALKESNTTTDESGGEMFSEEAPDRPVKHKSFRNDAAEVQLLWVILSHQFAWPNNWKLIRFEHVTKKASTKDKTTSITMVL